MGQQVTWTAIGDSLTEGTCDAPGMGGWVSRTVDRLSDSGLDVEVTNLAQHGASVGAVLAQQATQLPARSTIVSAIAGANDLMKLRMNETNLYAAVNTLLDRAAASGEIVLTATCPDLFVQRFGANSRLSPRVERLNHVIRAAVTRREDQFVLLDTHEMFMNPALWATDNVHPNELGHAILAEAAADLLRSRLRKPVAA